MPSQTTWVEPELFLDHGGVKVLRTYKNDDLDQKPNRFWFTLNPECGVEASRCGEEPCRHVFDVRELSYWQTTVQPPYCTGENNTLEIQAAWDRYWAQEEEAIQNALKVSIESHLNRLPGLPRRLAASNNVLRPLAFSAQMGSA